MPVYIDGFPFDLAVTAEPTYQSELTKHPIDAKALISDHIIDSQLVLSLECVVSDTPTGAIASHSTRQNTGTSPVLVSDAAWNKLFEIRSKKRAVTVETGRRTYERMVITSLSERAEMATAGGAYFTVTLEQATIVENKRVTVRVAVPLAKGKSNLGPKNTIDGKAVDVIYVITFPVAKRAEVSKGYGPPLATNVNKVKLAIPQFGDVYAARPPFDCFRIKREVNAEGYLVKVGKGGNAGVYEYYEFSTLTDTVTGARRDSVGRAVVRNPGPFANWVAGWLRGS